LIDAGINPDGSLYSIRVRQSSGNKTLDEAAINIVRMGVPYSPLPKELLDEIDVLVISRVWQFSDETGISTSQ
jgi:protein TonB